MRLVFVVIKNKLGKSFMIMVGVGTVKEDYPNLRNKSEA